VRHCMIVLALTGSTANAPAAQSPACRPHDADARAFLLEVQRYASATVGDDAAVRVGLHLPLLAADSVRLATDEALCRRAAAAYRRLADGHTAKTLSGRVYVIEAGERYVVLDPDWRYNLAQPDVMTIRVFDERFRELAHY
jgi:hypothetical protein